MTKVTPTIDLNLWKVDPEFRRQFSDPSITALKFWFKTAVTETESQ